MNRTNTSSPAPFLSSRRLRSLCDQWWSRSANKRAETIRVVRWVCSANKSLLSPVTRKSALALSRTRHGTLPEIAERAEFVIKKRFSSRHLEGPPEFRGTVYLTRKFQGQTCPYLPWPPAAVCLTLRLPSYRKVSAGDFRSENICKLSVQTTFRCIPKP